MEANVKRLNCSIRLVNCVRTHILLIISYLHVEFMCVLLNGVNVNMPVYNYLQHTQKQMLRTVERFTTEFEI